MSRQKWLHFRSHILKVLITKANFSSKWYSNLVYGDLLKPVFKILSFRILSCRLRKSFSKLLWFLATKLEQYWHKSTLPRSTSIAWHCFFTQVNTRGKQRIDFQQGSKKIRRIIRSFCTPVLLSQAIPRDLMSNIHKTEKLKLIFLELGTSFLKLNKQTKRSKGESKQAKTTSHQCRFLS